MNIKDLQGPYKHVFMNQDQIAQALADMEADTALKTEPGYVRDNSSSVSLKSFKEIHLAYLKEHPKVNPEHYLSNLRTIIRKRS